MIVRSLHMLALPMISISEGVDFMFSDEQGINPIAISVSVKNFIILKPALPSANVHQRDTAAGR